MFKAIQSSLVLATAAGLVIACSGAEAPQEPSVGHTEEALGEAACGTNALTSSSAGVTVTPYVRCAWDATATSPATYGSTGCDNEFIVEIPTAGITQAYSFYEYPGATIPTDATSCANVHMTLGAYAHNATGWHLIGSAVSHGVWQTSGAPQNFSWCTYVNDTTWGTFSVPAGAGYDKVRAVGSEYNIQNSKGTPYNVYVPIRAGISGGSPC